MRVRFLLQTYLNTGKVFRQIKKSGRIRGENGSFDKRLRKSENFCQNEPKANTIKAGKGIIKFSKFHILYQCESMQREKSPDKQEKSTKTIVTFGTCRSGKSACGRPDARRRRNA